MQAAPETPSDFDMIIENAEGERTRLYLNIQIFSRTMLFWIQSFAQAIEENTPIEGKLK
jgi:hypothetical protein